MARLTGSNTLKAEMFLGVVAPTASNTDLWFLNEEEPSEGFDYQCERAFVAKGIGGHEVPNVAEWVVFALSGAIIAKLTGRYLAFNPEKLGRSWTGEVENLSWPALWTTSQERPEGIERAFMATMLRLFVLRHYDYSRWPQSKFSRLWTDREYVDTQRHSVGNLRLSILKTGLRIFTELPEPVRHSIEQIAQHVPTMLEIAIEQIRATYHW